MGIWDIFKKPVQSNISYTHIPGTVTISAPDELPVSPTIEPIDLTKVKFVGSPNKSKRKGEVRYIVLHHTGPGSFSGIVKWLCDKQAKASAHYVVGPNGELNQLVNTHYEAWHAGFAVLSDNTRIDNHYSIGIELCNLGMMQKREDGFYYETVRGLKKYTGKAEPQPASITYPSGRLLSGWAVPYPKAQLNKTIGLCKALVQKYPAITPDNILTHYGIGYPEGRKNDPFGLDVGDIIKRIF